jgi:hypothetical protein
MSTISFVVSSASTEEDAFATLEPTFTIYAEDLGLCDSCNQIVGNCYPCLQTSQVVYSDAALTVEVGNGYYHYIDPVNTDYSAVWHIFDGYPVGEGFYN